MAQDSLATALIDGLERLLPGDFSDDQVDLLLDYLGLLEKWNRTYNLTAVRDPSQMVCRHILDSVAVLPWIEGDSLLDAGTGAGLPGIPLAILLPRLQVSLLDSAGKKIRFLNHVVRQLGLENASPVQARLEHWEHAEPVPQIISRAFASIGDFARSSRHLAAPRTRLLAMKGRRPDEEMEDLPSGWTVDTVEQIKVPGLNEERHLVIMTFNPGT